MSSSDTFLADDYNFPNLFSSSGPSHHFSHCPSNHQDHSLLNRAEPATSMSGTFQDSLRTAIMSASHDMLIRSGNAAYISMQARYLQVKCEVEGLKNIITELKDVVNILKSSQPPTTAETTSCGQKPESLVAPAAPEMLEEDEHPNVPYWYESDWAKYCERQRDCGRSFPKLGFLTDEEGSPVVESRIKDFMSYAKQAWNELYCHRLDPSSWTKKTSSAASFFAQMMKSKFVEFCYCDGNWKVERFAIIKYPDWCRDARETGRLIRARPSKRKSDDIDSTKEDHKRRKGKGKAIPPTAQIIDLDKGIPDESTPIKSTIATGVTSQIASSSTSVEQPPQNRSDLPATNMALTAVSSVSALPAPLSFPPASRTVATPTAVSSASVLLSSESSPSLPLPSESTTPLHSNVIAETTTIAVAVPSPSFSRSPTTGAMLQSTAVLSSVSEASELPPSSFSFPSEESHRPLASTVSATLPEFPSSSTSIQSPNSSNDSNVLIPPQVSSVDDQPPPVAAGTEITSSISQTPSLQVNGPTPAASGDNNVEKRSERPHAGRVTLKFRNPLAGLSIRKPSFEVPATSELSTHPPPSTTRGSKSGKLMVASPTLLSARNLFALDYLKEHSPTPSEFKTVWDNIASETKKKYEALSKEKKSAARIAE